MSDQRSYRLGHDANDGWFIAEPTGSDHPNHRWRNQAGLDDDEVNSRGLTVGPIDRDQYLDLWLTDWPHGQPPPADYST